MDCLFSSRRSTTSSTIAPLLVLWLASVLGACGDPLRPPVGPAGIGAAFDAGVTATWPQVSVGSDHSCALAASGELTCWGSNEYGQAAPPPGTYTQLSAGYLHTCAVRSDGTIACWGLNGQGQATPPAGTFTQVSAGSSHSCGIDRNGDVTCWGMNLDGQVGGGPTLTPPLTAIVTHPGPFSAVSAGGYHTCAIRGDGLLSCWGRVGAVEAPPGEYVQLDADMYHTCAVRVDGALACWGNNGNGQTNAPAGSFTQVSTGFSHSCGVRADGAVVCWGYDGYGQVSGAPSADYFSTVFTHVGQFSQVSGGANHSCAAKIDGTVACWGAGTLNTGIAPHYGQSAPPFVQVAQTITFTSTPPNPALLGGSYSVSASGGSSGNPVLFSSLTPAVCTVGASANDASIVAFLHVGACTVAANQAGDATHLAAVQAEQQFAVIYRFGASTGGGFAPPVSSTTFNLVRAGQSVPVKFDLGGDQGLSVLASGSPTSVAIACPAAGDPVTALAEATITAGGSDLSYDAATGLYTYVWKTSKVWAGSCRRFTLTLDDGTTHTATFQFTR